MRHRHAIVIALATLAVSSACTSGPGPIDDAPYETQVQRERADKDVFFRSKDSPLPENQRAAFTGLAYFPIDAAYHVPANLDTTNVNKSLVLEMSTSINTKRRVRQVGVLTFTLALPGQAPREFRLSAFVEVDSADLNRVFVPFTDETSGRETYGGGRYIELNRTPTGLYDLDLNRAYQPYCVFNSGYECPVPPRENRLTVAVKAGERLASRKET